MKSSQIKTLILFTILTGGGLTSCENFLKDSEFQNKLQTDIDYAKASSYLIHVECEEGCGKIIGETTLLKKESDNFVVSFSLADG